MSKKKSFIAVIVIILIIVAVLWVGGIIPKQIAKIYGNTYMSNHFPEMKLKYVDIEWSKYHDDYIVTFKDKDNNMHSCTIGPKYFPINIGQGVFAIEEAYKEELEAEKNNLPINTEYSFLGKVIESDTTYIVVEPNEDEEEKKSSDRILIGLGENNDAIYMVGTIVKVTYDGTIMESYPAQVKAAKIEIKSAENFEILFKDRQPIDSYNKIYAILDKSETNKYNYTIYAYDGSVNIKIDGKEYSLKEALLENKITMEEIIQKANKDFPNAVSYDDGGSKEYHYDNYTIIKCHTLNGNRDVYIGTKDMTLNDVL